MDKTENQHFYENGVWFKVKQLVAVLILAFLM